MLRLILGVIVGNVVKSLFFATAAVALTLGAGLRIDDELGNALFNIPGVMLCIIPSYVGAYFANIIAQKKPVIFAIIYLYSPAVIMTAISSVWLLGGSPSPTFKLMYADAYLWSPTKWVLIWLLIATLPAILGANQAKIDGSVNGIWNSLGVFWSIISIGACFLIHFYASYLIYSAFGWNYGAIALSMPPLTEAFVFLLAWSKTGILLNGFTILLLSVLLYIVIGSMVALVVVSVRGLRRRRSA